MCVAHYDRRWRVGNLPDAETESAPETDVPQPGGTADEKWREKAACRKGMWSVDMWFDPTPKSEKHHCGRAWCTPCYCAAVFVCEGCPVRDVCRDAALTAKESYGVWGGMTEEVRRDVLRRRQRQQRRRNPARSPG